METRHDSLADRLRALRSRMAVLHAAIDRGKATGTSESVVGRDQRRELVQVRATLETLLPTALVERQSLVALVAESRQRLDRVRAELEEIAQRVREGTADEAQATARTAALDHDYAKTYARVREQEEDIELFHEFLPGGESTTAAFRLAELPIPSLPSRPVPPARPPQRLPPVVANAARVSIAGPAAERAMEISDLVPDIDEDFAPDPFDSDDDGAPEAILVAASAGSGPMLQTSRQVFSTAARERRSHRRYPFIAQMKFRSGGNSFAARTSDLSSGGMFIEVRSPLQRGVRLTAVFCADGCPVEIGAVVSFESPGVGMGIRFESVADHDRPYFDALLQQLAARG